MLAPWSLDIDVVRQWIRETHALTSRPFGVNLNVEFPQEDRLTVCLEEGVRVISFFWGDPASLVEQAKAAGVIVLHTAESATAARRAVDCGV
jgi:nitronate monooxygenase